MKLSSTVIKLGTVAVVLILFTAMIIVVFGQLRFDRTVDYSAEFTDASGLRAGQFVRASGVEIGKVDGVRLVDGGKKAIVDFNVDRSLPMYQSTTAQIRYLNLIGDRFLDLQRGDGEGAGRILQPGGLIPVTRTQPALDLDALLGGFKPLFKALQPEKVNSIASSLVTVFQGQGGTINDILDQTAQLTSTLADRDQTIGQLIKNLNIVLDTTVKHQKEFDQTVNNLEVLITGLSKQADPLADALANISNAGGTIGDLLADNRPLLKDTVGYLETTQQPLIDQQDQLNDLLVKLPQALKLLARIGGVYGDFFNFYLCDITVKLPGLQKGGPVRLAKITSQPTGRCTPQ
jgi:phospholipid/cholesterol/gamma-HCH transport system substrate-binding protein